MYEIIFPNKSVEKRFQKRLKKLDEKSRIKEAIFSLQTEPRPFGKLWKNLKPPVGVGDCVASCRIRVGDYRVLYDIDENEKKIVLLGLRLRSEKTYK